MIKKCLKIMLSAVILLAALWGAMFCTDYVRSGSLKEPIFVRTVAMATDGGSGVYQGLGYTVDVMVFLDFEKYETVITSVTMKCRGKVISSSSL